MLTGQQEVPEVLACYHMLVSVSDETLKNLSSLVSIVCHEMRWLLDGCFIETVVAASIAF